MQHSSVLSFITIFFMAQLLIALLVSYFLAKWVPLYRRPAVFIGYWLITFAAYAVIFYRRRILAADYGELEGLVMFLLNLSYVWSVALLTMLIGFIFISLCHLPGLLIKLVKKRNRQPVPAVQTMNRRNFLKTAVVALPCFSLALGAQGVNSAHSKIVLTKHQLALSGLCRELDGIKIAQISDSHIGSYFSMDKLKRILAMIDEEKPHLLVITGDFIDDLSLLEPTFDILNPFAAKLPYGAYFCWGNHEYFRNIDLIKDYFAKSPVQVLKNENKLVIPAASPLYIVGVDYPFARAAKEAQAMRQKYLEKALDGMEAKAIPILISHHSDFIEEAFAANIPLTLSGHTHGGQITLLGKSLLPVSYKYMLGIYSQKNCQAYVSTGAGHWLPFRFNCPAEVVIFTLKSSL